MKKLAAALLTTMMVALGLIEATAGSSVAGYAGGKPPNPTPSKPAVAGHAVHISCKAAQGAKGKVRFNLRRKGYYQGRTVTYKPGVGYTAKGLKPGHYKVTVAFMGAKGWGNKHAVKWFWIK